MRYLPSRLLKAAGMVLALSTAVAAQDYPTKPVRLVIPFPPGGSNDIVGRLVATQLGEKLGKQVIVENRGGAGRRRCDSEMRLQAPRPTATPC